MIYDVIENIILFSRGLSSIINIHEPLLSNYQQVFQVQNSYTEQLWLFLQKSYGWTQTIRTFSTLISTCLLIQTLLCDIHGDKNKSLDRSQEPSGTEVLMQTS